MLTIKTSKILPAIAAAMFVAACADGGVFDTASLGGSTVTADNGDCAAQAKGRVDHPMDMLFGNPHPSRKADGGCARQQAALAADGAGAPGPTR